MSHDVIRSEEVMLDKHSAIALAGSVTALARLLGVSKSAVSQWVEIPKGRVWQIKCLRPEWFTKKRDK